VTLSLISHTNAGKTTLKRTLLRRDVGEIDDQPHVTQSNDADVLVEDGKRRLVLWDTPGFGVLSDTLLRRLRNSDRPLISFLAEKWDRIANRSLWSSQMAVRNVREESDLVLYLVDLWQEPEELDFHVGQEMELLQWLGKPVLVLLNKTEAGADQEKSAAAVEEWRKRLGVDHPVVRDVMELDAFSRCWVQEADLMERLVAHVPAEKKKQAEALVRVWRNRNLDVFRQSTEEIGRLVAETVLDGEEIPGSGVTKQALAQLQSLYGAMARKMLGPLAKFLPGTKFEDTEFNKAIYAARAELEMRAVNRFGEMMDRLIGLHQLSGQASNELRELAESDFAVPPREVEEISAFAVGAALGLAGVGIAAEVGAHGLGGGAIFAALMAGPGAMLLAKGYNLALGKDRKLRWAEDHVIGQFHQMLIAYLAVAHFGRGRGEWKPGHARAEGEAREHWRDAVTLVISERSEELQQLWKNGAAEEPDSVATYEGAVELVRECAAALLRRLHPSSDWESASADPE